MTCCPHCQGVDRFFDQRVAVADLKDYQRHGPRGTTKRLLDILRTNGVRGMTLLDIGGGIGVIQHELSAAGVSRITGVDASRAYLAMVQQEAEKRGYAAGVNYIHGDFVALAGQIEPADVVTLDRVLCCYPDMDALLTAAAVRARRYLGLVYPRDDWWTKLGVMLLNISPWLHNDPFRSYIHSTAAVEGIAAANGLSKVFHRTGPVWQVVVFSRNQGTSEKLYI